MIDTCLVLAKKPVPGRVKTRLTPALTPTQAARLAAAALQDTLDAVDRAGIGRLVLVLDRPDPSLQRPGWRLAAQCAGGLDERIAHAFRTYGQGRTLLVGMDTPQVEPALLHAFDAERHDAALGLADDGGYWALALRNPRLAPAAVVGIPMSTAWTGAAQLRRLHDLGLRVQLLPELTDVDTVADAEHVAASAPHSLFATTLRDMLPVATAS